MKISKKIKFVWRQSLGQTISSNVVKIKQKKWHESSLKLTCKIKLTLILSHLRVLINFLMILRIYSLCSYLPLHENQSKEKAAIYLHNRLFLANVMTWYLIPSSSVSGVIFPLPFFPEVRVWFYRYFYMFYILLHKGYHQRWLDCKLLPDYRSSTWKWFARNNKYFTGNFTVNFMHSVTFHASSNNQLHNVHNFECEL